MRESASKYRKKYSSEIIEEDCSLEKYNSFLNNAGIEKTVSELAREVLERKGVCRILDIGCGNGKALWEMKKEFGKKIRVCGIDLIEPKFEIDEKIVGDAIEENFPDELDLIFSFRSLHEIGMPEKVLEKCCKSLAKGGRAFLSERAMEYKNGNLNYLGEMKSEDLDFLESVINEGKFGECSAGGKVVYNFEDAIVDGKKGTVAFIGGINVFLEKI